MKMALYSNVQLHIISMTKKPQTDIKKCNTSQIMINPYFGIGYISDISGYVYIGSIAFVFMGS